MDEKLRQIGEIDSAILRHKNQIETLTREYKDMQNERDRLAAQAANEMVECGCTASEVDGVVWSIRSTPQKVVVGAAGQLGIARLDLILVEEGFKVADRPPAARRECRGGGPGGGARCAVCWRRSSSRLLMPQSWQKSLASSSASRV